MADTRLYKVAITPKGRYVHGTEYDALCQVLYATEDGGDGCSYISLKPNKNVRPGTDNTVWAISLERGEKGSQGDPGSGFTDVDVTVDSTSGTPSAVAYIENETFYLQLSGLKGADGKSAYELAVEEGYTGTEEEWLASLHGAGGTDGTDGTDGKSAYEIAVDEGFVGTEEQWLASLKGEQGNTGSSVDYPYELVNNRTTDDATKGLSAAEGKRLGDDLTQLEHKKADKDTVRANMMTDRAKYALLDLFDKVAFAVPDVSAEVAELNTALFNLDEVVGVEATYNQGKTIWDQGVSSLDDLKVDLTVKAVYGDGTKVKIQNYTLSGTLTAGTSTITVTYLGFIDTFDVTVTVYGSKTSYVLSELQNLVGKAPDNSSTTYGWVLTNNAARQMALLDYGIQQIRNSDESESGYYPIPVPKTATKMTVAITQNALQIGGYLVWFDGVKLKLHNSTVYSWAAGGFVATITQDGDRQVYYLPVSKPSSGNYPSGQPTALTIDFE